MFYACLRGERLNPVCILQLFCNRDTAGAAGHRAGEAGAGFCLSSNIKQTGDYREIAGKRKSERQNLRGKTCHLITRTLPEAVFQFVDKKWDEACPFLFRTEGLAAPTVMRSRATRDIHQTAV